MAENLNPEKGKQHEKGGGFPPTEYLTHEEKEKLKKEGFDEKKIADLEEHLKGTYSSVKEKRDTKGLTDEEAAEQWEELKQQNIKVMKEGFRPLSKTASGETLKNRPAEYTRKNNEPTSREKERAQKQEQLVGNLFKSIEEGTKNDNLSLEEIQDRLQEIEKELNTVAKKHSGEDLYLQKSDLFQERRYLKRLLRNQTEAEPEKTEKRKTVSLKEGDRFIPESGKGRVGFRVSSLKEKGGETSKEKNEEQKNIPALLSLAKDTAEAYLESNDIKEKQRIKEEWNDVINQALDIADTRDPSEVDYVEIYDNAPYNTSSIKRAFEKLTPEERIVQQKEQKVAQEKGPQQGEKEPTEEITKVEAAEKEPKEYEHEISAPQLEEHKEEPKEGIEIEVPYTPEEAPQAPPAPDAGGNGEIPPEEGAEIREEEPSPLDAARLQYLKALKLRGNVFRGKFGRIFRRTLEVDGEKEDFGGREGARTLSTLRTRYEQALSAYREEIMAEFRAGLDEDIPEAERNFEVQMKFLSLLEEEQGYIDDAVLNKFEKTVSEKLRRWWRSKKGTWVRRVGGIGLTTVTATGAVTGVGAGAALVARGILGGFGMYALSEAVLERTKWLGLSQKGLADEVSNKYKTPEEIRAALENEYTEEEIRKEAARLRMLQIEKGTAIDSSFHRADEEKQVIRLIIERERTLIAESALKERAEGKTEEDIFFDTALEQLNTEITAGNKELEAAGELERHKKMVRKSLATGIGIGTGIIVGSKALGFLGGEEAEVPTPPEAPVETPEVPPDTTAAPEEVAPADTTEVPAPEVTPAAPETLGAERIVIDEKGEGMIKAIAEHLETTHELSHEKAMKIGNLMYIDGLKEYASLVENLAGEGVDIDALKELEFSITEKGLAHDEWIQQMGEFLESQGIDPSVSGEHAEALYEDGRMFNLVQLNDSFVLDLSEITADDLTNLSAEEIVEKMGVDYDSGTFTSVEATPEPHYDLPEQSGGTESIEAALKTKGAITESMLSADVREDYIAKLKAALEGFDAEQAKHTKGVLDLDTRLELVEQEAEYRELLNGLLDDGVNTEITQDQWEFYESLESLEDARNAGVKQVVERVNPQLASPEPANAPSAPAAPEPAPQPAAEAVSASEIIGALSEKVAGQTEVASSHILDVLDEAYGSGDTPNAKTIADIYVAFSEAEAPVTKTLTSLSDDKLSLLDSLVDSYVETHSELTELPGEEQEAIGNVREYIDALLRKRGK